MLSEHLPGRSRSLLSERGPLFRSVLPWQPRLWAGAILLCAFLHVPPAGAVEFGAGELRGSLDTTLSYGQTWRVESRDDERVSRAGSANNNDGNLNYGRGLISNTTKITTDLGLDYRNFGAFFRATGFFDFENEDGEGDRTKLSGKARSLVSKDIDVLDAYLTGAFEARDVPVDLRLGWHVLNWGESTFIPNGVNAFNPIDVSKIRLPGSELREALVPVPMASVAVAPNYNLSVEGFYQIEWEKSVIDPAGSYFSTSDYVGPGAREAVIPWPVYDTFGITSDVDLGFSFEQMIPGLTQAINADLLGAGLPLQSVEPEPDFLTVLRGADRTPADSGQGGIALRYLAEDLNQTEFGLYLVNYHGRLPTVSARTAELSGLQAGLAAASAVGTPGSTTQLAVPPEVLQAIVPTLALDRYADPEHGAHYYIEYPEDIQLLGASFNTVLGRSGWAVQGEYAMHLDVPLQRAERTILEEGLAPMLTALALPASALPAYLASYAPKDLKGYIRHDVSQLQATATKVFPPVFGADSLTLVGEAAVMHVHGMVDEPLESPARASTAGDDEDGDADATSWGYRAAAALNFNNAVGAVNVTPYIQWRHDVSGNSPAPSGPFSEGLTAITLGVGADYLSNWRANLSYTRYGGNRNVLQDRDFVSASISYSF